MKTYYVWADANCDNVTSDIEEAKQWCQEFFDKGYEDCYVVDEDGIEIFFVK